MADPVKVLYIAGAGRTGSTIVEKLLAQADGVFAAGELTFLWSHAVRGLCSCGQPLLACPVWTDIFAAAYGGSTQVDSGEMVALRRRFRSAHLPLMLVPGLRRRLLARLGHHPATTEQLYRAIRDATASRVIVDSSKEPHYSYILRSLAGLDVRVLHLVRDPRAVAYSWRRRREQKGIPGSMMDVRGPVVSAVYYAVSNCATEVLWSRRPGRYLRVRYEDFVDDPVGTARRIGTFIDEPVDLREVLPDGHRGNVRGTHSAWGNPNRFEVGPIELQMDDEWTREIQAVSRVVVTVLNGPYLAKYGYRLRFTHGRRLPPSSGRHENAGD